MWQELFSEKTPEESDGGEIPDENRFKSDFPVRFNPGYAHRFEQFLTVLHFRALFETPVNPLWLVRLMTERLRMRSAVFLIFLLPFLPFCSNPRV